jgi:hypothetical protein
MNYNERLKLMTTIKIERKSDNNILKYSAVIAAATVIDFAASRFSLIHQLVKQAVNLVFSQSNWFGLASPSNSLFHAINIVFLYSINSSILLLSFLIPSCMILIAALKLARPQWLPLDDPFFLKPLNYCAGVILFLLSFHALIGLLATIGIL